MPYSPASTNRTKQDSRWQDTGPLTTSQSRQKAKVKRKRTDLFTNWRVSQCQALYTILNTRRPCFSEQHTGISRVPVRTAGSCPHLLQKVWIRINISEQDPRWFAHTKRPCSMYLLLLLPFHWPEIQGSEHQLPHTPVSCRTTSEPQLVVQRLCLSPEVLQARP